MTFQEALAFLYSFTDYEQLPAQAYAPAKFDLRRVEELLHRLGDPHLGRLTVHIAGTKGKGSVAAMMASVLQVAGFQTGLLTSPHLCDFRERIRVAGQPIPQTTLSELVTQLQPEVEIYHQHAQFGRLTTFELVTVLAFLYFQQVGATAQVLEVGLGGRLDATNVVPKPDLCIITPISYDHMEILGPTLTAIAGEKAGIVKPGCPVVMAPQEEEARVVIAQRCYSLKAPLVDVARRVRWTRVSHDFDGQHVEVRGLRTGFDLWVPLLGIFQLENAATAVAGLETLRDQGAPIPREAIETGMARVRWPGRFQILTQSTLLVVDGAHNGASAGRLRETLETDFPQRRRILLVGVFADKDLNAIARELAPIADRVIAVRAPSLRAAPPEAIANAFAQYGVFAEVSEDVASGLAAALAAAGPEDLICATGSFSLVGEVLRLHQREAEVLEIFAPEQHRVRGDGVSSIGDAERRGVRYGR